MLVGQSCLSIPKNCWTRQECLEEMKKGRCYIDLRQTILFFCIFFSPPFFCSVERWPFLVQHLCSPSLSSRTSSDNRALERISSLSCGSLVLEQCVCCLRGTTYTRNLDKLLVSVGLFGFKCTLWLLFLDTYGHFGFWNISTSKVQQSALQNLKFKLFVLDFLCLQCYVYHLTFTNVFSFTMIFVPKCQYICLINIYFFLL